MIKPFMFSGIAMVVTGAAGLVEDHTMDVKTVCAVGIVVLGGAWGLSRRFTRIEDRLESLEKLIQQHISSTKT